MLGTGDTSLTPTGETGRTPTAAWHRSTPADRVRVAHLGLGAFHKAHQAWFTDRANAAAAPGDAWGIASFTGRRPDAATALAAQDGLYTVLTRGADGDTAEVVSSIATAHDGADAAAWRATLADPAVGVVTLTVTERGYRRGPDGRLDLADPEVAADLDLLRGSETRGARRAVPPAAGTVAPRPAAVTMPGRLVDGLRARLAAGGTPLAVVSCDNLPDNGAVTRRVVLQAAEAVEPALARWIGTSVSFVSTMVDRITPATTAADLEVVRQLTGRSDAAAVVTEPFAEWVVQDAFPAGRPAWDAAGVRLVGDVAPYEQRKLWLLNAGHSLLAYHGLARGLTTVAEAFADPGCRLLLEALWAEARPVLPLPDAEVDAALAALRERFANARIEHRLAQIGADGSAKLPVRILAVAEARRRAGLPAGTAQAATVAAWVRHVTGPAGTATDPAAAELAATLRLTGAADRARTTVRSLAPALADDADVVGAVSYALGGG